VDKRVHLALRPRLVAALAALLPEAQHAHPDVQWLLAPVGDEAGAHEAALIPLINGLGLGVAEQAALALSLWAEIDARWSALLGQLQGSGAHVGPGRPTVGLAALLGERLDGASDVAGDVASKAAPRHFGRLLQGAGLSSGLLQLGDAAAMAHARTLHLHPALLALLASDGHVQPEQRLALGRLGLQQVPCVKWPLPRAWQDAVNRIVAAVDTSLPSVVVLRGADRDELHAMAAQLARRWGRQPLALQVLDDTPLQQADALQAQAQRDAVVPALLVSRALPLWHAPTVPGSTLRLPQLAHWAGPMVVLAGLEGALECSADVHEFDLTLPDAADRLAVWSALQPDALQPDGALQPDARAAIVRSHCGVSVLARAAQRAARGANAREAIEHAVRAAARGLSAWAQVSQERVPADAWVGSSELHRELGLLLTRCIVRADAATQLGPLLNGRLSPGVKALFIGASGTGKTLAAQWLADRLARPLVRVDLASVVSKYIGETEKNLSQLLARAEHLDAVLLFDEADSLFGARTDVKQANDRYANMQTNYLLQRLETFHGVAVLTSNSKARFDDAFLRRLDSVIEFPLPDVAERRTLWSLHLGEVPGLDPVLLNQIAALVDLPGGHIRNAVLTAALLARQRHETLNEAIDCDAPRRIAAIDLRESLALEYRKLGQRVPDSLSR